MEPQTEAIKFGKLALSRLDWVIHGGESGAKARPFHVEWALGLKDECGKRGVPYFLKQLGSLVYQHGERLRFEDDHAGDWSEWLRELRVRQVPSVSNGGRI